MSKKSDLKQEIARVKKEMEAYANQPGHRLPRTRREFLTSGLMAASTQLMAPSLLSLISRSAWGQTLSCDSKFPTYVNLQLAGGPAMFANHLACGPGGVSFGPDYGFLGMGRSPKEEKYFSNNAPFYAPNPVSPEGTGSGFLRGLKSRMGVELFNTIIGGEATGQPGKTAFVSVACKSIDDRLTNKHDLAGMLARAGVSGAALPFLLCEAGGTNVTANVGTGIKRFKDAYYDSPTYLPATSPAAIEGALGFKGALLTNLSPDGGRDANIGLQSEILNLVNDLTQHQAEVLVRAPSSREGRKTFMLLAEQAAKKNVANVSQFKDAKFDIYENPPLAAIWAQNFRNSTGSFTGAFKNSVTSQIGTSVSAALSCFSGACTAIIGGYDYHRAQLKTREGQDNHDIFFGETVANILMTAHHLQQPLFLYVSADGSVNSKASIDTPTDAAWTGDYSERGMNYIIAYHPTKPITAKGFSGANDYEDANFQLNHFHKTNDSERKATQQTDLVVASDNPIANTDAQELAAAAVFLNFLSFAGQKEVINSPNLTLIKSKLTEAARAKGESDIFNYFSRIETA